MPSLSGAHLIWVAAAAPQVGCSDADVAAWLQASHCTQSSAAATAAAAAAAAAGLDVGEESDGIAGYEPSHRVTHE
jgi:hypothetical protein